MVSGFNCCRWRPHGRNVFSVQGIIDGNESCQVADLAVRAAYIIENVSGDARIRKAMSFTGNIPSKDPTGKDTPTLADIF